MHGRSSPPPLPHAAPRWRQAALFAAVFALCLPPMHGLMLWLLDSASLLLGSDGPWYVTLSALPAGLPGALSGSYLSAALPACAAGAFAGWWRPLLWRWQSWPAIGLLAMLAGAAFTRLLHDNALPLGHTTTGILGMSVPFLVAGTLLAWLCRPQPPGHHG